MQKKSDPVMFYGLVGVAAVGLLSLLTLSLVFIGNQPNQFDLTSITPPAQEQQTR